MAILKKEYEISVWDETLAEKGKKQEFKRAIIGAHDMDYLGRATLPKLVKKINGTHIFTFQLPSKYFDSQLGEYVHNEFCDYLFNERKVKLKYRNEWYEFYVKNISEVKNFKSIMYQYTCEDAFIDELARNGYGITFDTELYNNVEEIGTFSEEILEDSIWTYDATKNWGDFTETLEERLFRVPVSYFKTLKAHKLNYQLPEFLENVYTHEKRALELGDDLAREKKYFWDNGNFDKGIELLGETVDVPNDGYLYFPYTQLDFCYIKGEKDYTATEMPAEVIDEKRNLVSYALAPNSIDPTHLIQFIAIPEGAEVKIDEDGLILNKDYTYVMTLKEWNSCIETIAKYNTELKTLGQVGNNIVLYDGYLEEINGEKIVSGKKIAISDRTEINTTKDIDQYVTVYNNKPTEYSDMFTKDFEVNEGLDEDRWRGGFDNYRVCSKAATRVIVPQLARNLVCNGEHITDVAGWEVMRQPEGYKDNASTITLDLEKEEVKEGLLLNANVKILGTDGWLKQDEIESEYRSFVNFGIIGQEYKIEKDKVYALYLDAEIREFKEESEEDIGEQTISIIVADGSLDSDGQYTYDKEKNITIVYGGEIKNKVYYLIKSKINIDNPYFIIQLTNKQPVKIKSVKFFEAYTRGEDFFKDNVLYKYSGRDIFINPNEIRYDNLYYSMRPQKEGYNEILLETDIMEGDAYEYRQYFIQQYKTKDLCGDTFMIKNFLDDKQALDPTKYSEDDYRIVTNYIDLNKCPHYNSEATVEEDDCRKGGRCMYQKYGYCPYMFTTQKHCRKIRTLNGEKSNRFNLTQELSEVFECYPVYYTKHDERGKIETDKEGIPIKRLFYITEKGKDNKMGFRYEKNLKDISRTVDSSEIVTKLYVEDVDSDLAKTGMVSIKTAEDNPSKDSFIIDFTYYIDKGLLDKKTTDADLYGKDGNDLGYLKHLGYLNTQYDILSNKIINLQGESYTELEANVNVNLTGIETIQKEMNKTWKTLQRFKNDKKIEQDNETYQNYLTKYKEQKQILYGLVEETFGNDENKFIGDPNSEGSLALDTEGFLRYLDEQGGINKVKETIFKNWEYTGYGMMSQYVMEHKTIEEWKKQRAKYLKDINALSLKFFRKYEPFLKEGTWSDSNYLTDNAYYYDAQVVAKEGAVPKNTYQISTVDLEVLDEDYSFDIADTTYIEDIEAFGVDKKTGFPNKHKVLISQITYDLDVPMNNSIEVQNYTTQFEDLFQKTTAAVQSLSFNENMYKRTSNFTATKNLKTESIQGSLLENQLTLMETDEKNIEIDHTGQSGSNINNHANKYKTNGEGIYFSNDGGQSWNVGLSPKDGINADYIKVGTLDANKIQIVNGNYLYFLWDKAGINAYREPMVVGDKVETNFGDFARFNKYGLSLVEDNHIRLRAGYSYKHNEIGGDVGSILEEQKDITDNDIGFFLYNTEGIPIFRTFINKDLKSTNNVEQESAKIFLLGEMYVTDTISETSVKKATYKFTHGYNFTNAKVVQTELKQRASIDFKSVPTDVADCVFIKVRLDGTNIDDHLDKISTAIDNCSLIDYNKTNVIILETTQQQKSDDGTEYELVKRHIYEYSFDYQPDKYAAINDNIISLREKIYAYRFNEIGNVDFNEDGTQVQAYTKSTNNDYRTYSYYIDNGNFYKGINDGIIVDILSGEDPQATETAEAALSQVSKVYYKKVNDRLMPQEDILLYSYNGTQYSYWSQTEKISDDKVIEITDAVALYLNNTNINSEETRPGNERLICTARGGDESSCSNIFTVLKNGNLYIGGRIIDSGPANNLNNTIKDIQDCLLRTDETNIYIDFSHLMDTVSGKDLGEWLALAGETVGPHIHELIEATATLTPVGTTTEAIYLPSLSDDFVVEIADVGRFNITDATNFKRKANEIDDEYIRRCVQTMFDTIITLMQKGKIHYTFDYNKHYAGDFNFSTPFSPTNGKYKLTFENSYTGGVVGSGSSGANTTAYGLIDPIKGA